MAIRFREFEIPEDGDILAGGRGHVFVEHGVHRADFQAALLVKPALKETLKSFDASQYGGAPLLGLKGLVVKTHGSAKAIEVEHSIDQCVQFKQQHISEKIEKAIHKNDEM